MIPISWTVRSIVDAAEMHALSAAKFEVRVKPVGSNPGTRETICERVEDRVVSLFDLFLMSCCVQAREENQKVGQYSVMEQQRENGSVT